VCYTNPVYHVHQEEVFQSASDNYSAVIRGDIVKLQQTSVSPVTHQPLILCKYRKSFRKCSSAPCASTSPSSFYLPERVAPSPNALSQVVGVVGPVSLILPDRVLSHQQASWLYGLSWSDMRNWLFHPCCHAGMHYCCLGAFLLSLKKRMMDFLELLPFACPGDRRFNSDPMGSWKFETSGLPFTIEIYSGRRNYTHDLYVFPFF